MDEFKKASQLQAAESKREWLKKQQSPTHKQILLILQENQISDFEEFGVLWTNSGRYIISSFVFKNKHLAIDISDMEKHRDKVEKNRKSLNELNYTYLPIDYRDVLDSRKREDIRNTVLKAYNDAESRINSNMMGMIGEQEEAVRNTINEGAEHLQRVPINQPEFQKLSISGKHFVANNQGAVSKIVKKLTDGTDEYDMMNYCIGLMDEYNRSGNMYRLTEHEKTEVLGYCISCTVLQLEENAQEPIQILEPETPKMKSDKDDFIDKLFLDDEPEELTFKELEQYR